MYQVNREQVIISLQAWLISCLTEQLTEQIDQCLGEQLRWEALTNWSGCIHAYCMAPTCTCTYLTI